MKELTNAKKAYNIEKYKYNQMDIKTERAIKYEVVYITIRIVDFKKN